MKKIIFIIVLIILITIVSCDKIPFLNRNAKISVIRIGYTEYNYDQSVVMVIKGILDQQVGFETEIYKLSESAMFENLANGELDIAISGWLPLTHQEYLKNYSETIKTHTMITDSLGIYLAVPYYSTIDSIDDLIHYPEYVQNTIIIPEKANAIYEFGKDFIKDYGLENFELRETSWDNILKYVEEATKNEEDFAFIGFRPHWIFNRYNIKELEDYKNTFGNYEQAYICVNNDFSENFPVIAKFLANINFTLKDVETIMESNQTLGSEAYENALRWINMNTAKINKWLSI